MDTHETSPDELLDTFRGRSMKSIILFTLAVHAVVILGTSVPFLWRSLAGPSDELTEEQRVQAAVKEASVSLRRIADQHGIQPQDLSTRLAGGSRPTTTPATEATPSPPESAITPDAATDEPKSAIEKEIGRVEPGPEVPPIPDEEEDLFK